MQEKNCSVVKPSSPAIVSPPSAQLTQSISRSNSEGNRIAISASADHGVEGGGWAGVPGLLHTDMVQTCSGLQTSLHMGTEVSENCTPRKSLTKLGCCVPHHPATVWHTEFQSSAEMPDTWALGERWLLCSTVTDFILTAASLVALGTTMPCHQLVHPYSGPWGLQKEGRG